MNNLMKLATLFATAAVCAAPGLVSAQDTGGAAASNFARDRNVSVRERPRPDFEAAGVRLGGFMAYPRLGVDVVFDDNIYAAPRDETDDVIVRYRPEIALNSNWSRHALSGFARAVVSRYQDNSDEDMTDYVVGGSGRVDFMARSNFNLAVSRSYLAEPRTAPTAPTAALEPTRYYLDTVNAGVVHEMNRLKLTGRVNYSDYDYRNAPQRGGGTVFQQDRDREMWTETVRVDYALSPDTALYGVVVFNQRDYRLERPVATFDRDSEGYEAAVGANFDLTALLRGEIQVGYLSQEYDDPRFQDVEGFALRAAVDWFPTELTTVGFTASRSVEETVSIASPGFLQTAVGARVDHELLRNVLLSARASYTNDDYEQVDREDKTKSAGVSATYLMNRNIGLTLGYDYLDRESDGRAPGTSFTDNKVTAGITLQL